MPCLRLKICCRTFDIVMLLWGQLLMSLIPKLLIIVRTIVNVKGRGPQMIRRMRLGRSRPLPRREHLCSPITSRAGQMLRRDLTIFSRVDEMIMMSLPAGVPNMICWPKVLVHHRATHIRRTLMIGVTPSMRRLRNS